MIRRRTADQWGGRVLQSDDQGTGDLRRSLFTLFRTLDEVREAVLSFRQEYNRSWRLENWGFLTLRDARQRYEEHSRLAAA